MICAKIYCVRNFDFVKFQNHNYNWFLLLLKIEIAKSKTLNCIRYLKRVGTTYWCHCDDIVGLSFSSEIFFELLLDHHIIKFCIFLLSELQFRIQKRNRFIYYYYAYISFLSNYGLHNQPITYLKLKKISLHKNFHYGTHQEKMDLTPK